MKANNRMLYSILFLVFLSLSPRTEATISGSISIDPAMSTIQQTGVTYTFSLSSSSTFYSTGRLLIIFPSDFTFTASQTVGCQDASNNAIQCDFNYLGPVLTLKSGIPNRASFSFKVTGISNPKYSQETGYFIIRSYQAGSTAGTFTFVENSATSLTVTPLPGTLTSGKKVYFCLRHDL